MNFPRPHKDLPKVDLSISTGTYLRILALIIGTVVVLAALRRASHALILIFTAFFLTLALNAPVHWLAEHLPGNRRGSRSLATTLSFLTVVIIIAALIASIAPPLVRQSKHFIDSAPSFVRDIKSQDSGAGRLIHHYHLEGQVDEFSKQLADRLKHASSAAVSTVSAVGSSVFSLLTILVLTFMMLVEGPRWLEFGRELLPEQQRAHAERLSRDMYRVIKGYVNGQVILAAIAAVLITPALFFLHINYPIALMVVVFTAGLIPMVGHTIGAVIVTLVALFHSTTSAAIILIYYILYQQIENYLIQPRIQANTTNMSPLLVFMSVVVGVSFGGLFGGLVAIPVGGCLRILVLDILQTHRLTVVKDPVVESEIKRAEAEPVGPKA